MRRTFNFWADLPMVVGMRELADAAWPDLLADACRGEIIVPVFQPIIDIVRGVVCGYEGLSRFVRPQKAHVVAGSLPSPQMWFEAAAWHGFSGRLEAAALEAILRRRPTLPANCFLSVNLSPSAVLAQEVQCLLSGATGATAAGLSGLVIEITEQTPVEDYGALTEALDALRSRGAMIAVDDVGAGYASLTHLLALRPQFVKLDRALVEDVDREPHRAAAVAAIGALAGELDAWLVAEGVERSGELDRLSDLDVPLVQGYLLGRPEVNMRQVHRSQSAHMRARQRLRHSDVLSALSRPVKTVHELPAKVAEVTVLVDERNRPLQIMVPAGGRRADRHAPMCVQREDDVRDVALRAAARPSEDRYGPLCLCDERGCLLGIVSIEVLLEALARRDDDRRRP